MTTRILLVDDHPIVRAGLRAVIQARGFDVVGEASSGEEALGMASALRPDVVMCDLRLGAGIDGVDTTTALRRMPEPPAVIILTTFDHDAQIIRAVEAGAAGYLLKDVDNDTIVAAITDAAAGAMVLTPGGDARVIAALRAPRIVLTDREREVLELLSDGASNKQISSRLYISESTVKTHVVHLLEKLGVASRSAAASEARRRGLL